VKSFIRDEKLLYQFAKLLSKEGMKDGEKGVCYRREEADSEKINRVEKRVASKVVSSCERGCVVCGRVQGAR